MGIGGGRNASRCDSLEASSSTISASSTVSSTCIAIGEPLNDPVSLPISLELEDDFMSSFMLCSVSSFTPSVGTPRESKSARLLSILSRESLTALSSRDFSHPSGAFAPIRSALRSSCRTHQSRCTCKQSSQWSNASSSPVRTWDN